ncbi:MAG TPA: (2Fe-2S) ferredoxin domain-containing protein [Firmicutes bacterium]|nr:(2Fe-2S) ferredoxin domain-containing protein [Bacillota bacterium]HHY98631.1 (2Fe-2S) ferredoxin domain-containing protein [Bacillota bacterium]
MKDSMRIEQGGDNMRSLSDLERIRQGAIQQLNPRVVDKSPRVTFIVHMGTEGIAAGARDVLLAILDELKSRRVYDCRVTQTHFTGFGLRPPVLDIIIPGRHVETYSGVTPDNARQIVNDILTQARAAVG